MGNEKAPHQFRLKDPGFLDEQFDTEDGPLLKQGVEKVIEKMEILSSISMKNKKFKVKAEKDIDELQKSQVNFVQKENFFKELDTVEKRIMKYIRENLTKHMESYTDKTNDFESLIQALDKKIGDYRSQVLWRVKDCEELLRSRVANQEMQDQIKALESRVTSKAELDIENTLDRMRKIHEESNTKIR